MGFICPICQVRVPNGNEEEHYRGRRHRNNELKAFEKIPQIGEGNMQDIVPDIIDIIDTISESMEVVAVEEVTHNRDGNLQCLVQDMVDVIDTMSKSMEMFSNGCSSTSELARGANESPCIAEWKKMKGGSGTGAETVDPNCGTNKPSLHLEVATTTREVAHKGHGTALRGATKMPLVSKPLKTISKKRSRRHGRKWRQL